MAEACLGERHWVTVLVPPVELSSEAGHDAVALGGKGKDHAPGEKPLQRARKPARVLLPCTKLQNQEEFSASHHATAKK